MKDLYIFFPFRTTLRVSYTSLMRVHTLIMTQRIFPPLSGNNFGLGVRDICLSVYGLSLPHAGKKLASFTVAYYELRYIYTTQTALGTTCFGSVDWRGNILRIKLWANDFSINLWRNPKPETSEETINAKNNSCLCSLFLVSVSAEIVTFYKSWGCNLRRRNRTVSREPGITHHVKAAPTPVCGLVHRAAVFRHVSVSRHCKRFLVVCYIAGRGGPSGDTLLALR